MPSDAPRASCLYVGRVTHRRHAPFAHTFAYRVFQAYLDLDELTDVFRGRWLWSTTRPAVAWFRREDHLGDARRPLKECVLDLVEERLGRRPRGPVRLLTHLRYFGYVMNPVSFYYCHGDDGEVAATVAEVHNTPWGERHCYVLAWRSADGGACRAEHPKEFHVSPFLPMELSYRWKLTAPGAALTIGIEDLEDGRPVFEAALSLTRREISGRALAGCLARRPWMTARVTAAIYWQAFRLWWKGATFHPHPGRLRSAVPAESPHRADAAGREAGPPADEHSAPVLARHSGPAPTIEGDR